MVNDQCTYATIVERSTTWLAPRIRDSDTPFLGYDTGFALHVRLRDTEGARNTRRGHIVPPSVPVHPQVSRLHVASKPWLRITLAPDNFWDRRSDHHDPHTRTCGQGKLFVLASARFFASRIGGFYSCHPLICWSQGIMDHLRTFSFVHSV